MSLRIRRKKMVLILICFGSVALAMQNPVSSVQVLQTNVQQLQPIVQPNNWWRPSSRGQLGGVWGSFSRAVSTVFEKTAYGVARAAEHASTFLTRSTSLKVQAGLVGLGALYGVVRAVLNRARIYEHADKHEICKMPARWGWFLWLISKNINDNATSSKIKIYNWRLHEQSLGKNLDGFPSASTIRYPVRIDINSVTQDEIKKYRIGIAELLLSDSGIIQIQSHASISDPKTRILDTIESGLHELRVFLNELQGYSCFPSKRYDCIGIEKLIDDCCLMFVKTRVRNVPLNNNGMNLLRNHNIDEESEAANVRRAFDLNELSLDQERGLDNLVRNAIRTKWVHWLTLRPNFGLAATLYWEVLKRIKRLEAIQGIIDEYYGRR